MAYLIGILDVGSSVTPAFRDRLRDLLTVLPGVLTRAAVAVTVVSGVLLILLAHALRRRKRRAWAAVVALLVTSIVFNLLKGLDVEEAAVALLLLVVLIYYRGEFYAVGDPRTRWRALSAFVLLAGGSVAVGMLLLTFRGNGVLAPKPLSAQLDHVVQGLVGLDGPLRFRSDRLHDIVTATLGSLGLLTVLVTGYLALRPYEPVAALAAEDEQRMRDLLAKHGHRDSLGYFNLRRDKSVIWSTTGKSCIAYRVVSGVMLASSDPLGDPEAWPGAIAAFLAEAERHAWVPAVMACSEAAGEVWVREAGLVALEFGDEAIVDVADFSMEGRAMRNVRQMVARVERAGYVTEIRRVRELSADEVRLITDRAAAWRQAEPERGFSMALGRFGDPADGDCVVVMARDADGWLRAVLEFVPWGPDGLSLSLMRRDRTADPGLNELLIVAAIRAAPSLGASKLSLNFAAFRGALERGERLGAGPISRMYRAVLVFMSRWFQIESLYRFNAKFRPIWEPRYVMYPGGADLPRVGLAVGEAETFLVWPHFSLRPLRRLLGIRPG